MQSTVLSDSPLFGNSKRYHPSPRHHSFIEICIFVSIAKIIQVTQFNMMHRKRRGGGGRSVTTFLSSFVSKEGVEETILWHFRVT